MKVGIRVSHNTIVAEWLRNLSGQIEVFCNDEELEAKIEELSRKLHRGMIAGFKVVELK